MFFIYVSFVLLSNVILRTDAAECKEGVNNRFTVSSYKENLLVTVDDLLVDVYDINMKPSCANGEANVVLPGYIVLSKGEARVPTKLELANNSYVRLTASSEEGTKYCSNGKSMQWFLPDDICSFNMCEFIGNDMCNVLQEPGVHTIDELVQKIQFNPKIQLPNPPCFLGVICITDFFGGKYHVEFSVEYKKQVILHYKVPMDKKYLQLIDDSDDD